MVVIETSFPLIFFLCTEPEMMLTQKKFFMKKAQVKINILYFELISKPNVYILGLKVYTWKLHDLETILTSNDVMNNQDYIGKVFGSIEKASYMVVNNYFVSRRTNIPYVTPNYVPVKSKFEIDYYRQTSCFTEKLAHKRETKLEESGQEVIYSSKNRF